MVAARKLLLPGTSHEMVIRVHYRNRMDQRRFKPVSLISNSLAPLTHGGQFSQAYPGYVRETPRLWPVAVAVEKHRRPRSKP